MRTSDIGQKLESSMLSTWALPRRLGQLPTLSIGGINYANGKFNTLATRHIRQCSADVPGSNWAAKDSSDVIGHKSLYWSAVGRRCEIGNKFKVLWSCGGIWKCCGCSTLANLTALFNFTLLNLVPEITAKWIFP